VKATALRSVALLLAVAAPAAAQRAIVVERFDASIAVNRDGSIDVAETIRAHFMGSWNGIYRVIPVKYKTGADLNWTIQLSLTGATDEQGTALRTETSRDGALLKYKIWVPGAQDAIHTVTLKYHARNALRFFQDHDELYWNVTGNEWDFALGNVSATITLPVGAAGVRATAFNGEYGATGREAQVVVEGNTVRIGMPRKLEFREGLTAVVGWNKGLVAEPSAIQRTMGFLATNWPLALPIPVLILMLVHWSRRGRDPRRLPISVQYEPPAGMTPAEVGTLTDESADMRDITASMVDLAVRGFLKIEEVETAALFGLFKERDYVFHRIKTRTDWDGLTPHEQRVLQGIFTGNADAVKLSDLKNKFYTSLPGIKDGIMERLVEQGLYAKRPDSVDPRATSPAADALAHWIYDGSLAAHAAKGALANGTAPTEVASGAAIAKLAHAWDGLKMWSSGLTATTFAGGSLAFVYGTVYLPHGGASVQMAVGAVLVKTTDGWRWATLSFAPVFGA